MVKNYDRILTFLSVHHAIRAEVLLQRKGIDTILVPTPREIDVSCGQCLLFSAVHTDEIFALLEEKELQWSKFFACPKPNEYYRMSINGGL